MLDANQDGFLDDGEFQVAEGDDMNGDGRIGRFEYHHLAGINDKYCSSAPDRWWNGPSDYEAILSGATGVFEDQTFTGDDLSWSKNFSFDTPDILEIYSE